VRSESLLDTVISRLRANSSKIEAPVPHQPRVNIPRGDYVDWPSRQGRREIGGRPPANPHGFRRTRRREAFGALASTSTKQVTQNG